ncbi:unnamed protein product [Dracunculus medinensis]|uniref:Glycosyltransferase 25 family member n=1 Tax=Dracunculus medinensis TaxID=318479 RepID=A0A0N4UEF2_DRAME|nr:unnamed protein product [Dracunculus medinensis]
MKKKAVVISPLFHGPFDLSPSIYISEEYNSGKEIATLQINSIIEPFLIDLSQLDSSYLTFSPDNLAFYPESHSSTPLDVFSLSASRMNIPLFVNNELFYGYVMDWLQPLNIRRKLLLYFLADLIVDYGTVPIITSHILEPQYPKPSLFGVDKIYLINLERRSERLQKMKEILKLLGIEYTIWKATDGSNLLSEDLYKNISFLPGYEDPYYKRPMKTGEVGFYFIGCFLSHYRIWRDIIENSLKRVIVFEDDLRFLTNATDQLTEVLEDLDNSKMYWNFIYLGRKRLENTDEYWVPGHRHLSTVGYSYWTLGYLLNFDGAKKLLNGRPLQRLLPVDEYIPIMFDKHPNETWKNTFPIRNLAAYTMYPTIVVPERYTNEEGYISDTEASEIEIIGFVNSGKDEL